MLNLLKVKEFVLFCVAVALWLSSVGLSRKEKRWDDICLQPEPATRIHFVNDDQILLFYVFQ